MKLSKKQFSNIVNGVIKQIERDYQIAEALDLVVKDGYNHSLVYVTPLIDTIIESLDSCFPKEDGVIQWWFWDGPEHGLKAEEFCIYRGEPEDRKKYIIKTADDLYDYIEEYYND